MTLLKGHNIVEKKLHYLANRTKGPFVKRALRNYGFTVLALAQMRSPVGAGSKKDGAGGRFKGAWQVNNYSAPGVIAGIIVSNPMVYGPSLEYGSQEGKKPWPHAGPRTVVTGGRIYSSQAPDGILSPMLPTIMSEAAKTVYRVVKG
jgi:hypothetical protein